VNEYKQEVLQAAIHGMIEGGWSRVEAEVLLPILERVFVSGYNEAKRDAFEKTYYGA
jgi:hypothetical protein